ncbi:alpha/beta hydrolase [Nocardia cyriacigeorgica]|uniref:Alpha/beta hydrolase n=1 Tax=Nocardia cyriacigeorgica TaxID=135487 RepID=A0A6P1CZP4_9NOCA|nr:alpha/beta hydrolase [Nocardia cyriacigeorgica]NEW40304.1 alpha/beta hydrolase [Nocardia cyriacigeorgica]NEW43497.1 alpha/beta hydrolase [Nocardia cyriacigeorgica]NEW50748.1 alpha/beta hydrolase [Nocardia cyriacigeorgica]NEW54764.1 alpha/beta hydrolase [Nocardia cyriacigeorgica]
MGIAPLVLKYLADEPVPMGPQARQDAPGSFMRLSHGITHYEIAGPSTGEPVLFLSGATLSQWIWDGMFERIAAAGARTIRYDRYGMGFSDRPHTEYHYELFEAQILDLIDRLEVDRPITIVALAFGAPIAAEFAVRNPHRVSRVCMIAPDGFGVPINLGLRIALLPVIGPPFFRIVGDRALAARIPGYSTHSHVVARVASRFRPELRYRGFKRALLSALRNIPIHNADNLYRDLDSLGIPLQILWGTEDRITPPPNGDRLAAVFSHADIRFLDGVGHLPHFEQPDTSAAVITEFISRVPAHNTNGIVGGHGDAAHSPEHSG